MTENQRLALSNFLAHDSDLCGAITQFLSEKQRHCEGEASSYMRTVPRNYELASDYAAKAEVYAELWKELERWSAAN